MLRVEEFLVEIRDYYSRKWGSVLMWITVQNCGLPCSDKKKPRSTSEEKFIRMIRGMDHCCSTWNWWCLT